MFYGGLSEIFEPDSYYTLHTLPSGKPIKILNVTKAYGVHAEEPPMLILNYETDLPINDIQNLEKEAQEIWEVFKIEVEKEGVNSATVRSNEKRKGFLIHFGKAYGFVYKKSDQGIWQPYKQRS